MMDLSTIDWDLVVLLFILFLLILTYKENRSVAGYNKTIVPAAPVKTISIPLYPGVPRDVLIAMVQVADTPNVPPSLPTVPALASPDDAASLVTYAVTKMRSIAPTLELMMISLHNASVEKEADGTQHWEISTMLYERVTNVSIKVVIKAVVSGKDHSIGLQNVTPESSPLPPSVATSPEPVTHSTGYASYELPISSI